MPFPAEFFDGLTARSQAVSVEVRPGPEPGIRFFAGGAERVYPLASLRIEAKLGSVKRIVNLADGGMLEAADISQIEALVSQPFGRFQRLLHYLENHLGWVILSLLLTIASGWAFFEYGIPKLAEYVVSRTPRDTENRLGTQVLALFDHEYGYFHPSKTPAQKQSSISKELKKLCASVSGCPPYRLEFRDGGKIGANALALPGGIMVVTDQLIALSKNDTEIVAVLAHELGHVQYRHAFRQSLQSMLSGLILAAVTGDASSAASGLSGFLLEMHYSQANESQADRFALAALTQVCLPPKSYADILLRLDPTLLNDSPNQDEKTGPVKNTGENSIADIISTHPNTAARIKPFLEAKTRCENEAK